MIATHHQDHEPHSNRSMIVSRCQGKEASTTPKSQRGQGFRLGTKNSILHHKVN
jgi:hypothetical protein